MTETYINCIENNHGNFFKINEKTRNLYFELAAILNKYVKTFCLAIYIINEVEDLKHSWSAHKSKHGRRLILYYVGILSFFMTAILKTIQNGG